MSQLTIAGQQFEVNDDPSLVIGALMTEGHVSSLQQTRRENIRNNFAERVKAAGADLTAEGHQSLQQALQEYASNYQFGVRAAGTGRRPVDPVEKEMLRMAKEDIAAAYFAKMGDRLKGDPLNEAADKLLSVKGEDYNRRARNAIRDRDRAAEAVLAAIAA